MLIVENIYQKDNPGFFAEIKRLVSEHPRAYFKMLNAKYSKKAGKPLSYLRDWINAMTLKLSGAEYRISTKVYWILNNIVDFPKCVLCGKEIGVGDNVDVTAGYPKYCVKCWRIAATASASETVKRNRANDSDYYEKIIAKRQKTCLEKHDKASWTNQEKNVQTCREHYGVDNISKAGFFKERLKRTLKERYGNENYVNKEKAIETNKERYGVDWPMQSHALRKKCAIGYEYDEKYFDSKGELCYYIWLTDMKIDFDYQPNADLQYEYNGKIHVYLPDFKVNGRFVEIKGDHFFKPDGTMRNPYDSGQDGLYEAKRQCMLKNGVKILRTADYMQFVKYVKEKYGTKFIAVLKVKKRRWSNSRKQKYGKLL